MLIIFLHSLLMAQKTYIFNYILFFLLTFSTHSISSKTIIGTANVIDGDTIHIGKNKIRLHGIDAPEIEQTCNIEEQVWNCGLVSFKTLQKLTTKKEVTCKVNGIDQYKRYIAECYLNNLNINQYMVKQGWAIAYRYYSKEFVEDEEIAQKNKSGIWQGTFIEPYLFRKNHK